jgi:NADH oxidase (H2O2-forming)
MFQKTDVLVVGGGPAGITFCRHLRKLRPEVSITMLRPEAHSMVYCAIPYAIQGLFDPAKVYKKDDLVTQVGVNLVRQKAEKVDLAERLVVTEDGTTYRYETLFIATGALPIAPPIDGADATNVFTVKTQTDMLGILEKLEAHARRAVVVGAGAIGIEQAQAYQERGLAVHLVDMADRVLPAMLDPDMAEPVHAVLREKGIDLRLATSVTHLEKSNDRVHRVVLSDGTGLDLAPETDFVCFAVGMRPDVELFRNQGLALERDGIVVDAQMRTNLPGVLAAGDCCQFVSTIDGKVVGGKLATNAVPMGKVAARTAAGIHDAYPGFVNGAATCAYQLRMAGAGFTEEAARQRGFAPVAGTGHTQSMFPMMPGASDVQMKLVVDSESRRVLGGQVVAEVAATDKIDVVTLAIQQGLTVDQLARFSYSAQPWQSFFPARHALVEASENALDQLEQIQRGRIR